MTGRIEPVLSAEEWAAARDNEFVRLAMARRMAQGEGGTTAGLIGLLNDMLPDSDPRKITRARIALMRYALGLAVGNMGGDESPDAVSAAMLLDALASYLPPE